MNIFDKLYKDNSYLWWKDCDEVIKKWLSNFKWKEILDLWVWDWRNAIYLISKWFKVVWVDISKIWLDNLYKELEKNNQENFFRWIQTNLNNYTFEKRYNNIICNYLLHFLDYDKAINLLNQIKENTEKWWINILSWFCSKWDLNLSKEKWVFDLDFFKTLYKDWEVLFIDLVKGKVTEKTEKWDDKYHYTYNVIVRKQEKIIVI